MQKLAHLRINTRKHSLVPQSILKSPGSTRSRKSVQFSETDAEDEPRCSERQATPQQQERTRHSLATVEPWMHATVGSEHPSHLTISALISTMNRRSQLLGVARDTKKRGRAKPLKKHAARGTGKQPLFGQRDQVFYNRLNDYYRHRTSSRHDERGLESSPCQQAPGDMITHRERISE